MKDKKDDYRSFIPIVSLMSVILGALIFIAGLVFGVQFNSSNSLSSDSLSSWLSALATVAISVLTFFLAKETWNLRLSQLEQLNQLRRESIRPNVIVDIHPSVADAAFLDVSIKNIGKGVAHNLSFAINFDEAKSISLEKAFNRLSIFRNGCEYFGIGQTMKSYFIGFDDLRNEDGIENIFSLKINIAISYGDSEKFKYENKITIDFSDFEGVQILEGSLDPTYSIFQELKKIRKDIESVIGVTVAGKRIKVDGYSAQDRAEEIEKIRSRIETTK